MARNKINQIVAVILATLLLGGALIYYNILAPNDEKQFVVYKEGDVCPNFKLTLFNSKAQATEFSLEDCKGKVTIINYWQTTCGPCVAELPYFEKVQNEYSDEVQVVAVHSYLAVEPIQKFIDKMGWNEWNMMLAWDSYDNKEIKSYEMLGGKGAYPITAILDKNGTIFYVRHGELPEPLLREKVTQAIAIPFNQ